jgi:hypothetical protein
MPSHNHSFVLPDEFDDYEWEVTAKGWFGEARLVMIGRSFKLNFYDPARLSQEVESQMENGAVFFEPNLLVVQSVTKAEMQRAVDMLVKSGQITALVPE